MADGEVKKKKKKETQQKQQNGSRELAKESQWKAEGSAGKQVTGDGWACQWFTWQEGGQLATDTSAI